jgi:hypothetical protein
MNIGELEIEYEIRGRYDDAMCDYFRSDEYLIFAGKIQLWSSQWERETTEKEEEGLK